MRSILSLWLPALVAVAQAATPDGHIFFYDQETRTHSQHHHTVNAKTAGLILASRLGVEQYHTLGVVSDDTLNAINDFGHQNKRFEEPVSRPPVALLLATSEKGLDKSYKQSLRVSTMPSTQKTKALFEALHVQQAGKDMVEDGHGGIRGGDGLFDEISRSVVDSSKIGAVVRDYRTNGYNVIVVINPEKTSSSARYGDYVIPAVLQKRQAEAPLEDYPLILSTSANETTASPMQDDDDDNKDTSPLPGILPFCYSSKSLCEDRTRNCTGHGSCSLAYTQRDTTGDSDGVPCYKCACTSSIRQNSDGTKKTTVWAGPACQKKDVTTPFWLLAGFSVFMVFLVSWGIGTLLSMGSEELPSVIGAGVSGPTKK